MQNFTNESHIFCHLSLRTKKNFWICHANDLREMTQLSTEIEVWEFVLWQTEEEQAMSTQTLLQQRLRSHHCSGPLASRPVIDGMITLQRGVKFFLEDTEFQCGNQHTNTERSYGTRYLLHHGGKSCRGGRMCWEPKQSPIAFQDDFSSNLLNMSLLLFDECPVLVKNKTKQNRSLFLGEKKLFLMLMHQVNGAGTTHVWDLRPLRGPLNSSVAGSMDR